MISVNDAGIRRWKGNNVQGIAVAQVIGGLRAGRPGKIKDDQKTDHHPRHCQKIPSHFIPPYLRVF
jgi:hypothetical protein